MKTNAIWMAATLFAIALTASSTNAQNQADAPQSSRVSRTMRGPKGLNRDGQRDDSQVGGPGNQHGPKSDRQNDRRSDRADRGYDRHERGSLTSLTTVSGTVGQWVGNEDAILDGFTLTGGATPTTVKFPPHLGQQVQKAIKPGSTVSVTGFVHGGPRGETAFRMNSLTAGKVTVQDAPPVRSATMPPAPTLTTVTGKISDYKLGRDGRVNALVMDDKTVVRIPSNVAYQLTNLATKGSTITVQGYARDLREGQVQLEKTNILRASVLTINGQQYLVR